MDEPRRAFSRAEKIAALRRELRMRRHVYAKKVREFQMKPEEANREIAIIEEIIADYEGPSRQGALEL